MTKSIIRRATSEDSDQLAHSRSLIRVFADRMCLLQSLGCPKRDRQEPLPYWVDVHTDMSLCWSHKSYCRFRRAPAQFINRSYRSANLYLGLSAYMHTAIRASY